MLAEIIAVGVLLVALTFLVEFEKFGWSTVIMIASLIAYQYLFADIWGWFKSNYLYIPMYVSAYLLLGVGWSVVKWLCFLIAFKNKREQAIKASTSLNETYKNTNLWDTPSASNYKSKIIAWMCWWPISMIGTVLNDPVKRLLTFVYCRLSGIYQKFANKIVPQIPIEKRGVSGVVPRGPFSRV